MEKLDLDDFYAENYEAVFNKGLISKLSNVMHFAIEFGRKKQRFSRIIEVGSGHGQHNKFVSKTYDEYFETDIRILATDTGNPKVSRVVCNAENLEIFETESFDRLIATCLLVHLNNPELALNEWRRVIKPGGVLDIYVPCEPGLCLRLFQKLTTAPKLKKLGIQYRSLHYREHRNMWIFCDILIREIFLGDKIQITKFPLPIPMWNFRLFDVYRITKNV